MKMFTKLALVSSVAISANAMAMQSMDDAALSAATGQDGINIGIGISKIEIDRVLIHDNDGLNYNDGNWAAAPASGEAGFGGVSVDPAASPAVAARAGAIVIGDYVSGTPSTPASGTRGVVITANTNALLDSHNLADISIDAEAGAGGGNTAFLNVAAKVSGLNIAIGPIGVSASNAAPDLAATGSGAPTSIRRGSNDSNYNQILSGLTLTTGKMDANIQLGAAPQGAMIMLSTSMTGGLHISNLGILDNSTNGATVGYTNATPAVAINTTAAGEIRLDDIYVADANSRDLAVKADVQVFGPSALNDGFLKITSKSTNATDIYIKGVHLGSATAGSIGDVEVQGLQTYYGAAGTTKGAVITISGH